ncbi:hras-like suppressor 3 [Plakobranchus ocellatus]|uniref:Hras-like suppressor 3 n=1 Tax=Plakobranchus ocellatus TaxID=259542 RepID=A0AAV4AVP9_9GAST|nr:hras-like suppressor 3 [Plakobranchus ocellatus]
MGLSLKMEKQLNAKSSQRNLQTPKAKSLAQENGSNEGDGEIVHLTNDDAGFFATIFGKNNDGNVSIEKVFDMYNGKNVKIYVNNSRDAVLRPYPPAIIVKRAMSKLGKTEYNLYKNNCEHFANWCRYGRAGSTQKAQDKPGQRPQGSQRCARRQRCHLRPSVTAHTGGSSLGFQRCNNQHVWKRYNFFTNSAHYVGYDTDT